MQIGTPVPYVRGKLWKAPKRTTTLEKGRNLFSGVCLSKVCFIDIIYIFTYIKIGKAGLPVYRLEISETAAKFTVLAFRPLATNGTTSSIDVCLELNHNNCTVSLVSRGIPDF